MLVFNIIYWITYRGEMCKSNWANTTKTLFELLCWPLYLYSISMKVIILNSLSWSNFSPIHHLAQSLINTKFRWQRMPSPIALFASNDKAAFFISNTFCFFRILQYAYTIVLNISCPIASLWLQSNITFTPPHTLFASVNTK